MRLRIPPSTRADLGGDPRRSPLRDPVRPEGSHVQRKGLRSRRGYLRSDLQQDLGLNHFQLLQPILPLHRSKPRRNSSTLSRKEGRRWREQRERIHLDEGGRSSIASKTSQPQGSPSRPYSLLRGSKSSPSGEIVRRSLLGGVEVVIGCWRMGRRFLSFQTKVLP